MESTLKPSFIDLTNQPDQFFNILPSDWQDGIVPYWGDYVQSSKIYGLQLGEKIIGGGIIFSKVSPDTMAYRKEAEILFEKGLLYFGFLWIQPTQRGNDFGTFWLESLKKRNPENSYWLSIEEFGLHKFYEKNGFSLYKTIVTDDIKEWIMVPKTN